MGQGVFIAVLERTNRCVKIAHLLKSVSAPHPFYFTLGNCYGLSGYMFPEPLQP